MVRFVVLGTNGKTTRAEMAGEVPFGPFGLYRPEVDGFFNFLAAPKP